MHNQDPTYFISAIKDVYTEDNNVLILGLTGRTGSGCSTVANLLQKKSNEIKHSLNHCQKENPSNDDRKNQIIYKHFARKWQPFILVQVRSIITLFLLEDIDGSLEFLRSKLPSLSKENLIKTEDLLRSLNDKYNEKNGTVEFYSNQLPAQCEALKDILGSSNFVHLYQEAGKNIRLSGSALNNTCQTGKFLTLARRIENVVTAIITEKSEKLEPTYIVIDAIRNPLEANYLQNRFSNFYLLAITTNENDRRKRLRELKYSEEDIEKIDEQEYRTKPYSPSESQHYSVQDIRSCLEKADLYIENLDPKSAPAKYQILANQLIKFVSLIQRPGIITPTAIERCMQIAYTAKLNSGCISRQVGAMVTDENFSVRAIGWNDVPHGQVPCNLRSRDHLKNGTDLNAFSDYEKSDVGFIEQITKIADSSVIASEGRINSYCFKDEYNKLKCTKNQVHTRSLHAEENAFLQIAKYGTGGIHGGYLFTTASPCELCSKKAYQLGIKKIFYIDPYPGIAIEHILQSGPNRPELTLFTGAIGKAFHKLYMPLIPFKDELEALNQS